MERLALVLVHFVTLETNKCEQVGMTHVFVTHQAGMRHIDARAFYCP